MKYIFIVLLLTTTVLSGCAAHSNNVAVANPSNLVPQLSAEDQIKETINTYYDLIASKKFGEAYKYISAQSNITLEEYVDAQTQNENLVTGLKGISYNYINIASTAQSAHVNATITFTIIPLLTDATETNNPQEINLSYEDDLWKIIWKR